MFDLHVYLAALGVLLGAAFLAWLASVALRNVNLVDSLWGVMLAVSAACCALLLPSTGARSTLTLVLVVVWAARLCAYITWRNWGEPEDHRYRAIRRNNEPFVWKSLYVVFGLQAVLAWLISLSLHAAIGGTAPLGAFDYAGALLWLVGFSFETVADAQLARFKASPGNAGRVLDRGLWRYTRHPNYFGEFCVWWGFYCFAVAAGGWWALVSPLLMSVLLLRVSGVTLLEQTIRERRPAYADYVRRTSAFFPWPRRKTVVARAPVDVGS
jgi:steroid 5-alpha reductase family enzyme